MNGSDSQQQQQQQQQQTSPQIYQGRSNGLSLSLPPDHGLITSTSTAALVQPTPLHTSPHQSMLAAGGSNNNNAGMLVQDWMYNPHAHLGQNMHNLHPSYMFSTSEVSNEYSLLNDFVSNSMLDDTMFGTDDPNQNTTSPQAQYNQQSSIGFAIGNQPHMPPPAVIAGKEIIRPSSGFPIDKIKAEQFSLIAADGAGTDAPEQRLKKLLQAKYDAGLLRPFNYVRGYEKMYKYMKENLQRNSITTVSKQIEAFRPIFRERVATLTDIELVYVEIEFEKLLMKYDRVFASMAIPACCWRRTGEIYRGNKEMAELVNLPMDSLRDVSRPFLTLLSRLFYANSSCSQSKTAIHDIFAERGLVKYWKEFGKIAFVESQKAMITSVILKRLRPDGQREEIECCFSFTIQRDKHNM
jgi:hypothetical protein